ncbi:MAG TPA: hypothetical protein VHF24_02360, partial [Acidimicrobiales bacterium]|nr:hypothetical protein [Acidimicrobiales bacterium]
MTTRIVGVLLMLWGALVAVAGPAEAGVGFGVTPTFPPVVTAGQTGLPASLQIVNQATPPSNTTPVQLTSITLVPSCGTFVISDICPAPDPGVFQLSPTGIGEAGTACAGITFAITLIDPVQGRYQFIPPPPPIVLQPPGNPGDTCRILFTFDVIRVPTVDALPAVPGVQTVQLASAQGLNPTTFEVGAGVGTSVVTVLQAQPQIVTAPSPGGPVGTQVFDTATLSGGAGPAPGPTGTITFDLYGPGDPNCAGPPVFSSTVPVAGN